MNIRQISDYFIKAFPAANLNEQQLSLTLYQQLALGKPVEIEQLQTMSQLTKQQIKHLLHTWPGVFFDDNNNVNGFWGMTTEKMPHQLNINENIIYTWCAWDTLFIPGLINITVNVISTCPVTARRIELTVSPSQAYPINNQPVFLSFVNPDEGRLNDDVTTSFCHFVHYFDSRSVAEQWTDEHPDTFLLTLDDAFMVAKQVNAARYHLALH